MTNWLVFLSLNNRPSKQGKYLFKELDHDLAIMLFWWVEGIKMVHVCAQLFNSTSSEGVTGSNQDTKLILHKPECYLMGKRLGYGGGTGAQV